MEIGLYFNYFKYFFKVFWVVLRSMHPKPQGKSETLQEMLSSVGPLMDYLLVTPDRHEPQC